MQGVFEILLLQHEPSPDIKPSQPLKIEGMEEARVELFHKAFSWSEESGRILPQEAKQVSMY